MVECPCGRDAVYFRPYSGEYLCKRCFTNSLISKVKRCISKYGMLRHGERIGVAVSGGKDSLSLLYILKRIVMEHGSELVALTVDEGIAGYRDEALKLARHFCKGLGVEHITASFEELYGATLDAMMVKRESIGLKRSSCTICGLLRRRALDLLSFKSGIDALATAHNLDDTLQTFVINLVSHDIDRLSWMGPVSGGGGFGVRRIRPFIEIYEREVLAFAYLNGIPIQGSVCPYSGEGIRGEVRRFLNALEHRHPGAKYGLLRSAIELTSYLKGSKPLRVCELCNGPTSGRICGPCRVLVDLGLSPRALQHQGESLNNHEW